MTGMEHSGAEPAGREPAPGRLRIVQAFLNSTDLEDDIEALDTPAGLHAWAVAHGLAGADLRVTGRDLERAILLREGLRDLLSSHTGGRAVAAQEDAFRAARDRVNDALAEVSLVVAFADDGPQLRSPTSTIDGVFGELAAIVYTATINGTWQRLKTCRNDACRWAFYDASKNHSGAWCSMAICGSKHKARTYRKRQARPA